MDLGTINKMLERKVQDAPADLFPPITGKVDKLGSGDTYFSVEKIADSILTHYLQAEKVSKQLQTTDLQTTCKNVHSFLYNYFQYSGDLDLQTIKSPSYSWHTRYKGIDCKSYSVLAGAILANLGITFYIRQIKQKAVNPENFSHVYVIVPTDQKNGSLSKGYYTIDGTIPTTVEVEYTQKEDYKIMKLKHIGLSGTYHRNPLLDVKGLGCGCRKSHIEPDTAESAIEPEITHIPLQKELVYVVRETEAPKKGFFEKTVKIGWLFAAFGVGVWFAKNNNKKGNKE